MSTAPARTLVTGGTGFLGSHLVEALLAAGRPLTVVSRRAQPVLEARGVRVVVGPLHETATCVAAVRKVETVFHVAARVGVWGRYDDFYRDNVTGTVTLLAAARAAGVGRFIHTSTPSVVYNGLDLAGADESLPLCSACPSPYPLTKAIAERAVLAAHGAAMATVALRPHLIWGVGDPHLVPRILARARAGRLRLVGGGRNRVDMVHIANATAAHLAAEAALRRCHLMGDTMAAPGGRAYFITNDEPVELWEWVNGLLVALGEPPVTRAISWRAARAIGAVAETLWRGLPLAGEPPMTRFIADELAKDHWFDLTAAKRDLGYRPTVTMAEGMAALVAHLRSRR